MTHILCEKYQEHLLWPDLRDSKKFENPEHHFVPFEHPEHSVIGESVHSVVGDFEHPDFEHYNFEHSDPFASKFS